MSEKTSFFGHFWAFFDPSEKGPKIVKNRDFITNFCSLMLTMLTLLYYIVCSLLHNEFYFHTLMSKIVKKCRFLAIFDPQKPPILTPQNRPFLALFWTLFWQFFDFCSTSLMLTTFNDCFNNVFDFITWFFDQKTSKSWRQKLTGPEAPDPLRTGQPPSRHSTESAPYRANGPSGPFWGSGPGGPQAPNFDDFLT